MQSLAKGKSRKIYLLVFLSVLFFTIGCQSVTRNLGPGNNPTGILPIETLLVQIDDSQRQDMFAQLQSFAEKYNLKFSLTFYTIKTYNDEFFVVITGDDFNITGYKSIYASNVDVSIFPLGSDNPPAQKLLKNC